MRILLINSNRFKQPWPVIPFGLCCVASSAKAAGHEVRVLDLCFSGRPEKEISETLREFRPEVVGVSIRNIDTGAGFNTQFLLDDVRRSVIEPLKQAFAGPIIIGGPSVGINGAEMLEFFDLEFAIRGDGEAAFVEFLRRLSAGEPLDGLGGLVRRAGGRIFEDNPPMCVEDLAALPPARAWRWLNLKPYARAGSALQVQTKRGCALGCTYCTYNRIEGRNWRLRSPVRVADEITEAVRESGIGTVEFTDSTFNIPLDHCKAVLREVVARGLGVRFRTMGLNPGAVDEELADLLAAAGFRDVDLGVEAGSNEALRSLGKNFRRDSVLRAGKLLAERGIAVMWYLLAGAPAETAETLQETFRTVNTAASPWDLVNIGVGLRVYNGAPVAERLRRQGSPHAADNFFRPAALEPGGLALADVKLLVKREALRRTNYFMYDEDEKTPLALMVLGTALLRAFSPRTPIWRLFIIIRKVQELCGIGWVRRRLFDRRNRAALARLDGRVIEPMSRERVAGVLAGLSALLTVALGHFLSPWWLLVTAGVCCNLIVAAIANRCVIRNLLIRLGMPGERELGQAEALRRMATGRLEPEGRAPALGWSEPRRIASRLGINVGSIEEDVR